MKTNNGLQTRLGHGFAKFGRAGSVWRWEFSWNKFFGKSKENLQHGYDKGYLNANDDIFERLKTRFFKSVLMDGRYFEKANNFKLFLCSPEGKQFDELVFTLRFFKNTDNSIECQFFLCEFAETVFTEGTQNYFLELFAEYSLKIKNDTLPKQKISDLINQINQNILNPQKTLQQQFNEAIDAVFIGYEYKNHFYKVKPIVEGKELFLIFPSVTNLSDVEARFSKKLLMVAQKIGFDSFTFGIEKPTIK